MAGYTVARELRKLDAYGPDRYDQRDDGSFYSKPMLSNALSMKKQAGDLGDFRRHRHGAQLGAWHRRSHRRVERILPPSTRSLSTMRSWL